MEVKDNYKKYKKKTKRFLIGAICLIIIGMSGISTFFESYQMSDLVMALFVFILPGGWCAYKWNNRRTKFKEYEKYAGYIKARRKISIDNLCSKFGVDFDSATNLITEMINNDLINGYLTDSEIVMNDYNGTASNYEKRESINKETKVVKCKECGAKNTVIIGEKKECEYCGTILE